MSQTKKLDQQTIVNHLKVYGFVFPCSSIYGGIANGWDFGPVGALLKKNIKDLWWREYVTRVPNAVGLDSSIILNPEVWKASGHLTSFSDPLIDCKECHNRFRADHLIEDATGKTIGEQTSFAEVKKIVDENHIKCPVCGKENWTDVRNFNLMFASHQGVIADEKNKVYLRPETAQGIFVDFKDVLRTSRMRLPFAICQIGKAFRNEITPGNFIFRTREFEQMECEWFVRDDKGADQVFETQLAKMQSFLKNVIGLQDANVKLHEHSKDDLSHYSKRTIDIQYNFPHGFAELWGIANRQQFDLSQHEKFSKAGIYYLEDDGTKIVPYVIEPSVGVERLFYAICCDVYEEQQLEKETRLVMHFKYDLAPYKVAVLPLVNKLADQAREVFNQIIDKNISATFDVSGSIGKRYRRQDAIGTYYCVTFDYDSLNDQCVTIRNRDTMQQERIKISELINYLNNTK
ncbi:MAG: glycine--tRNA ligase [Malacoplasma sp.]|nr:glycine--tRNA ligase [Malacoplasma sp.]